MPEMTIACLTPDDLAPALPGLTGVLHACVHAGASVGFVLPFPAEAATAFWEDRVFPSVRSGGTILFAACCDDQVVGTVQLGIALPPNQPHRADVAKMLVHPDQRRQGIARRLMQATESDARSRGKTLLVLDTRSGDPAQGLYESVGFKVAGQIPGYCRNPFHEAYEATTYLYKPLV